MARNRKMITVGLISILMYGLEQIVYAATEAERIAELERKVEILTREQERNYFDEVFLEVGESQHGMGPAASKVYTKRQGVSIGGYGEGLYQNKDEGDDEADFLRAVLYFGYKYNEKWVFNSELEFEHASTDKEGSSSVEFAYLDYLYRPEFNLRAGLLLIPMGLINELHEPTVLLSARRPDVESRILPTTWRENGVGIFGDIGETMSYKAYLVNGLRGENFSAGGLRGGRQKGSQAIANDLVGVVRVDIAPSEAFSLGGSVYVGNSGQDLDSDLSTDIYEIHVQGKWRGWQARALGAIAHLGDVTALNRIQAASDADDGVTPPDREIDSVGEELWGWYVEIGCDVLNPQNVGETSLTPFVRYERYDTQDDVPVGFKRSGRYDVEVVTVGVNFKPQDEIVFKLDYQLVDNDADSAADQLNLAMGYVF